MWQILRLVPLGALAALLATGTVFAQPATVDPATVVAVAAGDLNDDAERDRAVLVSREGDLDLFVFLSADVPDARQLAGFGMGLGYSIGAWGTEPDLEITDRGAVRLTSRNDAIDRNRWTETLTILYRKGRVVVGGYTYLSRDTLDPDYRYACDVNLFNGKGFFNDAPIRTDIRAMPISEFARDGICPQE
ncbi:MAG: hypothetical protein AAGD13_03380 [Pseudomonadota bacterium]